jgi:hypothetical protein
MQPLSLSCTRYPLIALIVISSIEFIQDPFRNPNLFQTQIGPRSSVVPLKNQTTKLENKNAPYTLHDTPPGLISRKERKEKSQTQVKKKRTKKQHNQI